MFITYLEFYGITMSIATNWDVYHDFINLYLKNFVSSPVEKPNLRIQSMFPTSFKNQLVSAPFPHESMRKVGLNVYFDQRRIYHQVGNYNVFVQLEENDDILVYCEDHMRLGKHGGLRTAVKKAVRTVVPKALSELYGAFQTHMRLTFHFPLFWFLEAYRGLHLLHATALRIKGTAIIFSGLASVGKTTLATFLYSNYLGTDILTDNFLLYDSERIYAFPEASRLSKDGIEIASARSLLHDAFVLANRYHWIPRKPDPSYAVPRKAFLVCLGKNLGVEPISSEFFAETALGLNDVVQEFHNYSYVGLFPFATRHSFDIYAARARVLKSCMRNASCAVLTIPQVSSLVDIGQDILDVIL